MNHSLIVLDNDFAQDVIREFDIAGESNEAKMYLLGQLADNISSRILLKVTELVPLERQEEFTALSKRDDANALATFVRQYVSDWEGFVRAEAQKEIERTKAYLREETEQALIGGGQ